MKRLRKQQLLEQSIYGAIWTVIFLLPLIGGYFAVNGMLNVNGAQAATFTTGSMVTQVGNTRGGGGCPGGW